MKPFAVIEEDPALFDVTRRKARNRKARTSSLLAAVAVLATVGTTLSLIGGGAKDSLVTPTTAGPTVDGPSDEQLLAMAPECGGCRVSERLELEDGRTFAILGREPGPLNPTTVGNLDQAREYVLARGKTRLDAVLPHSIRYAANPRTDTTGNVIVPLRTAQQAWFLAFRTEDDKLVLSQGDVDDPAIGGDAEQAVVDADHDGRLELITTSDATGWLSWQWAGNVYAGVQCDGPNDIDPGFTPSPSCGLARGTFTEATPNAVPPPSWAAEVGCAGGCTYSDPILISGDALQVVSQGTTGYKVVLTRGDTLLGTLPSDRFTLDPPTSVTPDGHGNLLIQHPYGAVIPVTARDGKPVVLQGGLEGEFVMRGDRNTSVTGTAPDVKVLVTDHRYATATEPYKLSVTTWAWNVSAYAPTGCEGALCGQTP
jgi:hypothetical protein